MNQRTTYFKFQGIWTKLISVCKPAKIHGQKFTRNGPKSSLC